MKFKIFMPTIYKMLHIFVDTFTCAFSIFTGTLQSANCTGNHCVLEHHDPNIKQWGSTRANSFSVQDPFVVYIEGKYFY